jgi:hypothetical protein
MGPRATIGHLVGYEGDNGHIFQIWIPEKNKVVKSRDVSFLSGESTGNPLSTTMRVPQLERIPLPQTRLIITVRMLLLLICVYRKERIFYPLRTLHTLLDVFRPFLKPPRTITKSGQLTIQFKPLPHYGEIPLVRQWSRLELHRDRQKHYRQAEEIRKLKAKQELRKQAAAGGVMSAIASSNASFIAPRLKIHEIKVPDTYKEAISSPQKDHWIAATNNQIAKLEDKGTYEMVDCPKDARLLPGKWVFDTKTDTNNFITEWRARWVVCGNRQRPEKGFNITYAPVVTESATKLVLSAIAIWVYTLSKLTLSRLI